MCISANYRLSPAARFPDHLVDVKKVIAWVREHGDEYGADPSVLFVAGSSAGGNLASAAALTPNDPRFQPGFEDVDTSVTAAVALYGYYGHYGGERASAPHTYVRADAPPFFVAHGELDTLVLVEDARAFVEQLRNTSSGPVVYAELPGGAAHVRPLPLAPLRGGRRRDRGVRRLGPFTGCRGLKRFPILQWPVPRNVPDGVPNPFDVIPADQRPWTERLGVPRQRSLEGRVGGVLTVPWRAATRSKSRAPYGR